MKRIVSALCCILFVSTLSKGQDYFSASQEAFGKNRVQIKKFDWKTIKSNNFEINFYRGGDELSRTAATIAESEFDRITEVLGYTPFTTMKLFVYNSPKDLAQSNIGLTSPIDYDGSILNLSRSRVEIAYGGNDDEFKSDIVQQVSKLFVYDMLYGGSLKEVLQSSLMLTVPDWYMSGVARYISRENTEEEELGLMKAKVTQLAGRKLKTLKGDDAAVVGQSIWFYIAQRYGIDNISNILNLTRIIRDEQSSITSTLGISYNRFLKEWQDYYLNEQYRRSTSELPAAEVPKAIDNAPQGASTAPALQNLRPGEVDTENYVFDPANVQLVKVGEEAEATKNPSNRRRAYTRTRRSKDEFTISAPKAYQNLLITNDVKTEFVNDPVRRLGMRSSIMMNDMLENNVFEFGLFVAPSFRNHDIFASYKNNTNRIDWGIGLERRSIYLEEITSRNAYLFRPLGVSLPITSNAGPNFISRRILYHRVEGTVSYPLSNNLRVSGSPFVVNTIDIDYNESGKRNLSNFYTGAQGQVVFDNTRMPFTNVELGTKAKIKYERYVGLGNSGGFNRVTVDARHYQRVIKGIVLAARISYGISGGNAPKTTFLGGTENWLNMSVETPEGQSNGLPGDLRDIAFYNFAGSLRGFNFGKIYGNNHLLTNIELRMSIADFISNGAITSNTLKNLQLILFDDIGTAWRGPNGPFSRQNSLNTDIIGGGNNPFRATVTNFKNPFLMGYGFGARTSILGYFIRADYAWGFENKETNKPILHVSIGHDF